MARSKQSSSTSLGIGFAVNFRTERRLVTTLRKFSISISAGAGLTGGGDLSTNRTISMPLVGTAGTYGSSTQVPVITTDAYGRNTGITNTSIQITESQVTNLTTDLGNKADKVTTISAGAGLTGGGDLSANRTISMPLVGTAGTYGTASQVPVFTTDAYGRVSSVSNTSISIAASQITSGTLSVARGGTGLSSAGTSGNILVSDGTNFNSVAVSGDASLTSTGALTVNNIQGVPFSTSGSAAGSVMQYNGTSWAPATLVSVLQVSYETATAQGSALSYGQAVYATNSSGTLGVSLAQANSFATVNSTIGLVAQATIAQSTSGTIQTFGLLGNLNTSAFNQGQPVYVSESVAGGLTATKPQGPNYAMQVGYCVTKNSTVGVIYISPMFVATTTSLGDVSAATPAENDLLIYKSATSLWTSAPLLKIANTQNTYTIRNNDTQIPSSAFTNVVYLPVVVSGGNATLNNATGPIQSLTSADYGRILWIHNVDTNNRTITFTAGNNTWLEGGASITLPVKSIIKFMWLNVASGGRWVQTDKVITAS